MASCEHCGQEHIASEAFCPNTGKLIPSHLLPEGTLLEGKYRIGRTIGIGGMGAVFEARHTLLDKQVAIKVVLPEGGPEMAKQFSARLVREARAASATGHRNIALVTDMGWARAGTLFVVMEYLEGSTLREVLDEEPQLPVSRAVALTRQVLAGLDVVHRKGIVHRDLKPENLMLVQDEEGAEVVKILDFGISKTAGDKDLHLTNTGLVIGTPQYMSPEQARTANDVDHRTDIYSAGTILYRMVTGTLPHRQEKLSALISALLTTTVEQPSRRSPGLPPALDPVLLKAMAREPQMRYQSARAFSDALGPFEQEAASTLGLSSSAGSILPALSVDLDESHLVALDETSPATPAKAAPAPAPAPAPAAAQQPAAESFSSDLFAPPGLEEQPLELEGAQVVPRKVERPVTSPVQQQPAQPVRATGTFGQARRQQTSLGMWIALVMVAVGGLLAWQLFLREDTAQKVEVTPDAGDYVSIRIDVSPRWAEILVDGVTLTSQPLLLQRSSRQHMVTIRAKGYLPQSLSFTPEEDRSLLVELKQRATR